MFIFFFETYKYNHYSRDALTLRVVLSTFTGELLYNK
jgi:hypothetical protein